MRHAQRTVSQKNPPRQRTRSSLPKRVPAVVALLAFLAAQFELHALLLPEDPPAPARIFACMYETPVPHAYPGMPPVYTGVAVSKDGGATWTSVGWSTNRSNDLAVADGEASLLYLAVDQGLLRSQDGGLTWKLVAGESRFGAALAVETTGDTVFLGTSTGFHISTDGGETWATHCKGLRPLDGRYVSDIMRCGTSILIATADGVYQSENHGMSWIHLGLRGKRIHTFAKDPAGTGRMLALGEDSGLWYSDDSGATWKDLDSPEFGGPVQAAMFHPDSAGVIFVGTHDRGILKSSDGGRSWKNVSAGLTILDITVLAHHPLRSNILYAGTRNGAYISDDGGRLWRQFTLRTGSISQLTVLP
ncbi:MAG: hypothetical protein QHI48_09970 [Bacteroidota bacterium]|nr:hypothetical protein [Bacteroidota bacterium]